MSVQVGRLVNHTDGLKVNNSPTMPNREKGMKERLTLKWQSAVEAMIKHHPSCFGKKLRNGPGEI